MVLAPEGVISHHLRLGKRSREAGLIERKQRVSRLKDEIRENNKRGGGKDSSNMIKKFRHPDAEVLGQSKEGLMKMSHPQKRGRLRKNGGWVVIDPDSQPSSHRESPKYKRKGCECRMNAKLYGQRNEKGDQVLD